jgi:hypothetical protein
MILSSAAFVWMVVCSVDFSAEGAFQASRGEILPFILQADGRGPGDLPEGVVDPKGEVGFLPNATEGIDAVDLRFGTTLWHVKEVQKPLAATKRGLVAEQGVKGRKNAIRLALLDVDKQGKELLISDPLEFPNWVPANQTSGPILSMLVDTVDEQFLLRWKASWSEQPSGEVPRLPIQHEASGTFQMDLRLGRVATLPFSNPRSAIPDALRNIRSEQYCRPTGWMGESWQTLPLVFPKAATTLEKRNGVLSLLGWDSSTGKPLSATELLKRPPLPSKRDQTDAFWCQVTRDGRYLFVLIPFPREELRPADDVQWVFSLESGTRLAKIPRGTGECAVGVVGNKVFVEYDLKDAGRFLKAYDAKSSESIWDRRLPLERK